MRAGMFWHQSAPFEVPPFLPDYKKKIIESHYRSSSTFLSFVICPVLADSICYWETCKHFLRGSFQWGGGLSGGNFRGNLGIISFQRGYIFHDGERGVRVIFWEGKRLEPSLPINFQ